MVYSDGSKWEWRTLALTAGVYVGFFFAATEAYETAWAFGFAFMVLCMTLHSSLTHEALHGHPTNNPYINALLVFPSLSLLVPYLRFKDLHLAHHRDEFLTDPYDDPESNFMDPDLWQSVPKGMQRVFRLNNTLLGRMVIGPLLGHWRFMREDAKAIAQGDARAALGWVLHIPAAGIVIWGVLYFGSMPLWMVMLASYGAMSLLKVRTFLEHRAHDKARARTVVIEDRGIWAFLFLNNSFHVVHHMHPQVPWYDLPALYRARKDHFLARNEGYVYKSYTDIFKQFFFKPKDEVPHPLWSKPLK